MAKRREWTGETLAAGVRSGDKRALARAITLVENSDPLAYQLVRDLYPDTGRAHTIGITGPPGVGKSTLIGSLIRHVRADDRSVGVISVDPSSPFSHGALLGDRIRLSDHFLDPEVFIRSMGTRGHLGGLAETTLQAMLVLDAAGKDLLFVETVGAGQSEVEVIGIADTVAARADAGIRRLRPGAEGRNHGDPRRDRDQQDGSSRGEDDAERSALDSLARPRAVVAAADRADRGGRGTRTSQSSGTRSRPTVPTWRARGCSRSGGGRTWPGRCSPSPPERAKIHLEHAVAGDPELRRVLDAVQAPRARPLDCGAGNTPEGVPR